MKRGLGIAALILSGLVLVVISLQALGKAPLEIFGNLLKGSLGTPQAISGTLTETTPLLLAGVAVFFALRAGLFNIGVEGQFTVGACACSVVALRVPGAVGIVLAALAGMLAGGLWALPAGWIRAYRGGHEVITTIMLNSVAMFLTRALVAGPLKDPTQDSATTANIAESSFLPNLLGPGPWTVSSALILAIVSAVALAFWLRKAVSGYELRLVGANPTAAVTAGVDAKKVLLKAMVVSGAIGGLSGSVQVLAFSHRFFDGMSSNYGFDALGVALLAGSSAYLLIPSALLFGILAKGGSMIQTDGVPKGITTVILGVLVIIAAAIRFRTTKAVES
jgi:general nucleoside transport system permease protein